jgi:hypothetical protein
MTDATAIDLEGLEVSRPHRDLFGWSMKLAPEKHGKKKANKTCSARNSKPSTEFEIGEYSDLILVLRARCDELEISRENIDAVAGFPDRYAAKLLSLRHVRRVGLQSLGPLLDVLGLKLVPVIDEAAMRRNQSRLVQRDHAHWRSATARHATLPTA